MSLLATLQKDGRFPGITAKITALDARFDQPGGLGKTIGPIEITNFLSYEISSSVIIPVDTFSMTFAAPGAFKNFDQQVRSGDIIQILAGGKLILTGIIDRTDISVTADGGEQISIDGRDLMSQLEDNDAVSITVDPIFGFRLPVAQVIRQLIKNTRIKKTFILQNVNTAYTGLFATEPGESKLAALQRYLEPLNMIAFMENDGTMVIGKPNMSENAAGKFELSKEKRRTNVIAMRVARNPTRVPNIILPLWSGQENVQSRVKKEQALYNAAPDTARLLRNGHVVQKTVVWSNPSGNDPQSLSKSNEIEIAQRGTNKAGAGNILQAYAKRVAAKENMNEIQVQCSVPGHYNEFGDPLRPDRVYYIVFDRGGVRENMYLHQVNYSLSEDQGQRTSLNFCRLGSIVADVPEPNGSATVFSRVTAS